MNVISEKIAIPDKQANAVSKILTSALQSVDPFLAVRNAFNRVSIQKNQSVGLVSIGKAAIPMALGAMAIPDIVISSGIAVTKILPIDNPMAIPGVDLLQGNHPVPGELSLKAGQAVQHYVSRFDGDSILFLISGGASALVTLPVPGISLIDLKTVTGLLLACGASIDEMNAIRKHLDLIKGGRLAEAARPARCISMVLSDVPGDRLDVIASGPTVPDSSTYTEALGVLTKYNLTDQVPPSILAFLQDGASGQTDETPKPGNPIFKYNQVEIIGSLDIAITAAEKAANECGYTTRVIEPLLSGEARVQGRRLGAFLRDQAENNRSNKHPQCWITGGETTVTLTGQGKGGRNQELALAAVKELAGVQGAVMVTFATDGEDGLSPAAGAVVTGNTLRQAADLGFDTEDFLRNNDSYTFFKSMNAAIEIGSTGTNVNDLVVMLLN